MAIPIKTGNSITLKGQVTIPKNFRDQFGLRPGTAVEFQVINGRLVLRAKPVGQHRMEVWIERARGKGLKEMTAERILRETRGED